MIRFGPYELDPTQGLSRGAEEIRLTPKSLAVLWLLAHRSGRVVMKDELFEAVWADTAVTDSALATCIKEIRRALDDDARRPQYVETLHRRGYRFVAPTEVDSVGEQTAPTTPLGHQGPLVGRDAEVEAILRAFTAASEGWRQICFISGGPGVGKSAVFEASMAAMVAGDRRRGGAAVTWAHCVEQYGSGEPYQPLLDGLMRLCRQPGGNRIIEVLERYAPMWLAQLPGLLPPQQYLALQRTVAGASQERMMRELTYAAEAISAREPLVIGIEDLHWSDPSTLDWIAFVAQRTERARLMIVATMRPREPGGPVTQDSPLASIHDTLMGKRLASEVTLTGLAAPAVSRYVALRLPAAPGREAELDRLGQRVREHTGGNPLFMAAVLDQLVDQSVIVRVADRWGIGDDAEAVDLGIPDTIRPMIDRQVAGLSEDERHLLDIASVVGERFAVAAVAGAADVDAQKAETVLASRACRRFVREAVEGDGPAADLPRLAFVHALYRGALYDGIPSGRRAELHRRVGNALEGLWGDRADEIAPELAVHFEQGRDAARSVTYLQLAGERARSRSAFREGRLHYDRALGLLRREPAGPARDERELDLLMGLGAASMATSGWGAPEVEAAYSAARKLSLRIGDAPRVFPAVWGQWLFFWGRDDLETADELAAELRARAVGADDGLGLQALHASWATSFSLGRFAETASHAAEGAGLYDPERHASMAATYGSHDAGVCARLFAARALAVLGRVDDARHAGDDAVTLARSLNHPFSTALALTFRAAVDQSCGDALECAANATEGRALALDQGFALMAAWCTAIGGWASARLGNQSDGVADIEHGIAAARKTWSDQYLPFLLGLLAEGRLSLLDTSRGLEAVNEALAVTDRTGERFYEAELHRLRGELLLAAGRQRTEAAQAFRSAIDVARHQGAALFELRAAIALARLPDARDGSGDGRQLLRAARVAFPSDVRAAEVEEADALL